MGGLATSRGLSGLPLVPDPAAVGDETGLALFLAGLEEVLHALAVRIGLAWWEKYTETGDSGRGLPELQGIQSKLLRDPALGELVGRWCGRQSDPVLARKLAVLNTMLLAARVGAHPDILTPQTELMGRIVAFRPVVGGREISHAERGWILQQEPDRGLRREAWLSVAPLSAALSEPTVLLLRRRNELARSCGYQTYVDMALGLSSLTRAEVVGLIDTVERSSSEAYRKALSEAAARSGIEVIRPWDVPYLVEQATAVPAEPFARDQITPSLEATLRSFGQDPSRLNIRLVTRDIPFGGLCMAIDPPGDVRILSNPQDGHSYYTLLYHEYGHALHAVFAGHNSFILQEEPGVFAEGMAQVWGWFPYYAEWLRENGFEAGPAEEVRRTQPVRLMARHRSFAASVMWEYRAYDDPDQDLAALDARMSERYRLAVGGDVPVWAASPFPSNYPVYWQNYILADLIAAATHRRLKERFGDRILGNPEVFRALAETYWKPGASKPWRERLRDFTGCGLDAGTLDYRVLDG